MLGDTCEIMPKSKNGMEKACVRPIFNLSLMLMMMTWMIMMSVDVLTLYIE
jgi:hypothetical protein